MLSSPLEGSTTIFVYAQTTPQIRAEAITKKEALHLIKQGTPVEVLACKVKRILKRRLINAVLLTAYISVSQEERAEKVRLVEVYNARLSGREERRAFIRDRGLLNVKRMQVGPLCN